MGLVFIQSHRTSHCKTEHPKWNFLCMRMALYACLSIWNSATLFRQLNIPCNFIHEKCICTASGGLAGS